MKIMHVINSSGLGGAETVVREIISRRKDLVFCLRREKVERFLEVSSNVFFGTKTSFYKLNPIILFKLYRVVKKNKVEILHSHLANSIFYVVLLKMFCKNLKIVHHEHGEVYRNRKLISFLRKNHKKIDLFLAVSKSTKKKLVEKIGIPEEKIIVLYNFVDLEKFKFEKKKKEKFTIGYAGRLSEVKGCKYLISALKYLKFDYEVLIAGDGILRKELESKSNEKVKFLGYLENMQNFYPLIDVYAMPSLSEASPMAFYEAQAYGIPIIGSKVPAIDEFVIDGVNGFLFEVKNSEELAEKITEIYENRQLYEKMSSFSKKNVKKYSLDNYLQNLNEIYERKIP